MISTSSTMPGFTLSRLEAHRTTTQRANLITRAAATFRPEPLLSWQFVAASAARRTAFGVLLRVERHAAFSDELLHSARLAALTERERAFVTELVMGCLRRRGELDDAVSRRLHKALCSIDPEVLVALRLGAYQLRYMRSVPAHAAVSEAVELVKGAGKRSAAGLANAVLRRLPPPPPPDQAARLSHPDWLVRRWRSALGSQDCETLLAANLRQPSAYFRIPPPASSEMVLPRLTEAGLVAEPTSLPRAFRLVSGSAAAAAQASQGAVAFLDINSQRIAESLDVRPNCHVLDACAAPGGKARILAERGPVVAGDRSFHRLKAMRRLGCRGVRLLQMDAERAFPFATRFERILVDAPCSGTGTLARNPEIKWRLRPDDLEDLQARQIRILRNASEALSPGGLLVYSTCSLEPEENEHVVRTALGNRPGWKARRVLATLPGKDPGDGFQAWRIERLDK